MIDDEEVFERDELFQLVLCCGDGHAFERSREIQWDFHVSRSCLEPPILGQILFYFFMFFLCANRGGG